MKHLIYIAGPYAKPDPVVNTRRATQYGLKIYRETGHGVIVPHLSLLAHAMFPEPVDFWYSFDLEQLRHCTALLRLSGESTGADMEVAFAHENRIPAFDRITALYEFLDSPNTNPNDKDNDTK